MRLNDWLTLIAILAGPLVGVQVSMWLERRRQDHLRKQNVFKTLMSTRATGIAPQRVQALNMIDVEFAGRNKKDRAVVNAWKSYLDILNDERMKSDAPWQEKAKEAFVVLMVQMSERLGYDFDPVYIKKHSYYPVGLGAIDDENAVVRKGFADIFEDRRQFPVTMILSQPALSEEELTRQKAEAEKQTKMVELQENYLSGKVPFRVIIEGVGGSEGSAAFRPLPRESQESAQRITPHRGSAED